MERIHESDLKALVARLNEITGQPSEPHGKDEKGNYRANIGNYHLYFAYGAVGLHQMVNEGGGVHQVFGLGTKRELYNQLRAYVDGIAMGKGN